MSFSVIPKRRSAACRGLSTNPEATTFIENILPLDRVAPINQESSFGRCLTAARERHKEKC
jgi:hypothetical protein